MTLTLPGTSYGSCSYGTPGQSPTLDQVRPYIKTFVSVSGYTDDMLDGALRDQLFKGSSTNYLGIFGLLMKVDDLTCNLLNQQFDQVAIDATKDASEYALASAFPEFTSVTSVAQLGSLPIEWSLNYFKDQSIAIARNNQTALYIKARRAGATYDSIMSAANTDDLLFTDDGWLYCVVSADVCLDGYEPVVPVGYTRAAVYSAAEKLYEADEAASTLHNDKIAIGEEFAKAFKPGISYTPQYPSFMESVIFAATGSSFDGMNIIQYSWDFGDGQSASGKTVSHTYRYPQTYGVTLTAIDGGGQNHVYSETIFVRPPIIEVTYPNGYEDRYREFSTPEAPNASQYSWNYGDGAPPENDRHGEHLYATSGSYTVALTLTLDDGSKINSQRAIFVGPGTRYIQGYTINGNETWDAGATYVVQGIISVSQGASLTIGSGTTVRFSRGDYLQVAGTLTVTGVTFTADNENNPWSGITFYGAGAGNSRLQNCVIEHLWGLNTGYSSTTAISISSASPTITGCTIRNSTATDGIFIMNGFPTITNNAISGFSNGYGINVFYKSFPTIRGNTLSNNNYGITIGYGNGGTYTGNHFIGNAYGAYIYYSDSNPVISDNTYSGNTRADAFLAGTINGSVNWNAASSLQMDALIISNGASLTITGGQTVRFNHWAYLYVSGTLTATGVTFTADDGNNPWKGIYFDGSGASNSRLQNCVIQHLYGVTTNYGYMNRSTNTYYAESSPAVSISSSSPTITGCSIGNSTALGGIFIKDGSPTITNNSISGFSSGYGIYVFYQSFPAITGNILSDNYCGIDIGSINGGTYTGNSFLGNEYGVSISYSDSNPVVTGNTYSSNTSFDAYLTGTINGSVNWNEARKFQIGSLTIPDGTSMTITEGQTLRFMHWASLYVAGTLTATGVTFTADDPAHPWSGITFNGSGASNSRLQNCVIEHLYGVTTNYGYMNRSTNNYYTESSPAISISSSSPTIIGCSIRNSTALGGIFIKDGSPTITNNSISGFSSGYGIYVFYQSFPAITGNILSDNYCGIDIGSINGGTYTGNSFLSNEYGVSISYSDSNPVVTGNTYFSNTSFDAYLTGTIYGSVAWNEARKFQIGSLTIPDGTSMTITEGQTLRFTSGAQLYVTGALMATGVTFTADDTAHPWSGITFNGSGASNSRLQNCVIEQLWGVGTNYGSAAVSISSASPTITGCTIGKSTATDGIYITNSSATITNNTISGFASGNGINVYYQSFPTIIGNTLSDNNYAIRINSSNGGTYTGNKFARNLQYGFYYSGTTPLNATNCDWGSPSGPLDASDDRASGGWYNPNGLGDKVSDHVNYIPWAGLAQRPLRGDYDGDGKTDVTVWRRQNGIWYSLLSNTPGTYKGTPWGLSSDYPVAADYDGDGKADIAVWRPGNGAWYILPSNSPGTYSARQWGLGSDVPVPGDYDGDGKADIAVWRPGTGSWYILPSGSPSTYTAMLWGTNSDIAAPGDYDGDGKTDIAVFRPGNGVWYILLSSNPGNYKAVQWGLGSDIPVPGDYDGDSKTDIAVLRQSTGVWYILPSKSPGTFKATAWGLAQDIPVPADYDGDTKADIAVWHPDTGVWFIMPSASPGTYTAIQWGLESDVPISPLTNILRQ
jgi:parallel beta-helix repeat protein